MKIWNLVINLNVVYSYHNAVCVLTQVIGRI